MHGAGPLGRPVRMTVKFHARLKEASHPLPDWPAARRELAWYMDCLTVDAETRRGLAWAEGRIMVWHTDAQYLLLDPENAALVLTNAEVEQLNVYKQKPVPVSRASRCQPQDTEVWLVDNTGDPRRLAAWKTHAYACKEMDLVDVSEYREQLLVSVVKTLPSLQQ